MPRINNRELMEEIRNVAKIQQGTDIVPNILSNQIVPVIEVNPKITKNLIVANATCTNSTSADIIAAVGSVQDIYIVGVQLSFIKDVTSTSTYSRVRCTINGLDTIIVSIPHITLTAQTGSIFVYFSHPLKIEEELLFMYLMGQMLQII
jgi:hypothetical protein